MVKKVISDFRNQFNISMNTAIISAFSLLIALSWNTLITQYVNKISSYSPLQGQLFLTLAVTVVCVGGIVLASRLFAKKEEGKK
jgi:hypothetical protein